MEGASPSKSLPFNLLESLIIQNIYYRKLHPLVDLIQTDLQRQLVGKWEYFMPLDMINSEVRN